MIISLDIACGDKIPFNMSILVPPEKPMATICRVVGKTAIPGADAIESVKILGWNCVAKKQEFEVGDLCVYFTIGSVFPEGYPRVAFLDGKPLKSKVIRKTISQGLVAPMSWLTDFERNVDEFQEGDDVTQIFGIMKFVEGEESQVYQESKEKRHYPTYVPKTDEERIQNIPDILPLLVGMEVVVTRKEDGCSATFIANDGEFLLCSRNFILTEMDNNNQHFFRIAVAFNLREKMLSLGRNLAIQGEVIGPKVSGNRLNVPVLTFRVFNIFDISEDVYLAHFEVVELCTSLGLEMVPVLFEGVVTPEDARFATVENILAYAESITYGPDNPAEGIVVKGNCRFSREDSSNLPEEVRKRTSRVSFKAISNRFLLKHKL
jgi:RNA ligase (TIGR02306 family)